MGRNRRKTRIIEKVVITDTGAGGKAVGKSGDLVVFTSGTVPGDVADIRITKKKKKYLEGVPVKFHSYSEMRTEAICSHFGTCGGCKWQNLNYNDQLLFKQKQVEASLKRIGGLQLPQIDKIIPSENTEYYRNKLEFTFSNQKWLTESEVKQDETFNRDGLGFHIPGRFDRVVDVAHCYLQQDPSNQIRNAVKAHAIDEGLEFFDIRKQQGFLRNLIVRIVSTGEIMVILSFFKEDAAKREKMLEFLSVKFPEITSLMYVINPKKNDTISDLDIELFKGKDHITEEMPSFDNEKKLQFHIGPKSFYQTNSNQAYELYKVAAGLAGAGKDDTVYDLYTGTGTIANFIAGSVKKVVGVEFVPEAIEDAKANSKANGITNTEFFAGDMKDVLDTTFIEKQGMPDIVITDPPRAGMHGDVIKKLLEIKAPQIVYISCNPSTQARDLALLAGKYDVKKVQPVDMFPHTHHVENVVLLKLRGN